MDRRFSARQRGHSPNRDPCILSVGPWTTDDISNSTLRDAFSNYVLAVVTTLPAEVEEEPLQPVDVEVEEQLQPEVEEQLQPVEVEIEDEAFEEPLQPIMADLEGTYPVPCVKTTCDYQCTVGTRE